MWYRVAGFAVLSFALCTVGQNAGLAQKKPAAKSDLGSIEIYKGEKGYRYRIKNAEGKTVAMPLPQMSWPKKEDVLKALDELKETLNKAKPVEGPAPDAK